MFESASPKHESSLTTLLVWDAEGPAPVGNWTTVLWRQYADIKNPNDVSIVQIVDEKPDELRSKYLAWIYDLGEAEIEGKRVVDHLSIRSGFSYWWTSSIGQKFNCSGTSQINDAIKALALEEFVGKHKFTDIFLTSDNPRLADCIANFCQRNAINFQFKKTKAVRKNGLVKSLFHSLPGPIRALIFLLRYLVKTFPIYFVRDLKTSNIVGDVMFIDMLVHLDQQAISDGRFVSNYWTGLVDKLHEWGLNSNWAHLFFSHPVVPSLNQAKQLINTFNLSSNGVQVHTLVERPLRLRRLVTVITDFFTVSRSLGRLKSIREIRPAESDLDLWALHEEEWKNSLCGTATMDVCLKLSLFLEVLSDLPRQRIGVYITENQPWEMALIFAWKASGHGKLIGTPHTTVRYWDLRYFYDSRSYLRRDCNDLPLPDVIAVNGPVAYQNILSAGYPFDRVIEVEALRFLHLANPLVHQKTSDGENGLQVLVCGDFLAETNRCILAWLEVADKLLPHDTVYIFKPHPAYLLKPADYPVLKLEISEAPLPVLLANCDIVFTSNITSAAVDAYCLGVPVIQMLDGNAFNTSPLLGLRNVVYVTTPMELAVALGNAKHRQYVVADPYFCLDKTLPRWQHLLDLNSVHG